MSEASSTAATKGGTALASSLAPKKKARSTTTRKKATTKAAAKKAPAKKATAKKSSTKPAKTKRKRSTTTTSTTKRKRNTATAKRSPASLKTDLKKLSDESYATADFTRGAIVLLENEGVEILRDALMVMVSSKTPLIGGLVSGVALETLLDKVTDTYKKATVADRKAIRAVINWLRGDANTDEVTQRSLVALLHGQQPHPSSSSVAPTDLLLKPLRQ